MKVILEVVDAQTTEVMSTLPAGLCFLGGHLQEKVEA
jgi:hypothetical protein